MNRSSYLPLPRETAHFPLFLMILTTGFLAIKKTLFAPETLYWQYKCALVIKKVFLATTFYYESSCFCPSRIKNVPCRPLFAPFLTQNGIKLHRNVWFLAKNSRFCIFVKRISAARKPFNIAKNIFNTARNIFLLGGYLAGQNFCDRWRIEMTSVESYYRVKFSRLYFFRSLCLRKQLTSLLTLWISLFLYFLIQTCRP